MTRRINATGLALIKEFEGLRLKAYLCPAKVWTIGYGSTGPHVHPGTVITETEAEHLLRGDLDRFEAGVEKAIGPTPTTDNEFSAMVSLAFNVGLGSPKRGVSGFLTSSVLRKHLAGNKVLAAAAFLMWVKAGGKTLPGLVRRRGRERALYLKK